MRRLAAEAPRKGQSLWWDAWRRLRRNWFAMGGLVVVLFASVVAVLAPWILPFQPDYGQPWLGANPPGFAHPAVLAELRFDRGEPVVVPRGIPRAVADALSTDGTLTYTVHEIEATEYRIKLRRGKIDRITLLEGAERVDRIEVRGEREYLETVAEDGTKGPPLRDLTLAHGEVLPPALATDERILIVRVERPRTPEPERIEVVIEDGRAASIVRGGAEIDRLRLEGRDVLEAGKDGRPLVLRHLLGTDLQGRDVLSRVVYGGRISLLVGAVATLVTVLIGVVYGAVAGYYAQKPMTVFGVAVVVTAIAFVAWAVALASGLVAPIAAGVVLAACLAGLYFTLRGLGWQPPQVTTVGDFMMRTVDILYALPFMFLVILLMISFGRHIVTLFIALGAVQWLMMGRIVRGQVLSLKEKEFIEAARMSGAGGFAIIFRHLIPNTLGVVIVYATLTVPAIILQESFLAFIGLTVEYGGRTLDSWGSLVNQGRQALTHTGDNWWVLLFPSLAMAVTLFSLNFLGDGLRDALDPQLKGRS